MKILKTKKYSILLNILKYSFVVAFVFMLFAPVIFAGDISTTIDNPLGKNGPQDIPAFIQVIIKIVLIVAVPVVTLAIIYTGFLFVEARGKPEEITKAKKALTYTLIGSALLLGALVIAKAIQVTVNEIGTGV